MLNFIFILFICFAIFVVAVGVVFNIIKLNNNYILEQIIIININSNYSFNYWIIKWKKNGNVSALLSSLYSSIHIISNSI
jgi:hypothetical protein